MFRQLGTHLLLIHNIEPDQYREARGIPWTYGLSSQESYVLHRDLAKEFMETGVFHPNPQPVEKLVKAPKRKKCAAVIDQAKINLPVKPVSPREQLRRDGRAKWGSPEHIAKVKAKPQVEIIKKFWKGKSQSPLHVQRRVQSSLKTKYGNQPVLPAPTKSVSDDQTGNVSPGVTLTEGAGFLQGERKD